MPLHDRFLRTAPYERIFPDAESREATLNDIGAEIEERGEGGDDPGAFALLTRTRKALAELRDREAKDDGGHTHAILLFHAYHLHRAGAPHFLATVPAARRAVEGAEGPDQGGRTDDTPAPGLPAAAYVQLPRYLFWVRESAEDRPVALDGFFRTEREGIVHLLGVADLPAAEAGLRVIPLPGVPAADAPVWLREPAREAGEDFASDIPGAELEGLYELRTAGEFLKLSAGLDDLAARSPGEEGHPDDEGDQTTEDGAGETPGARAHGGVAPSALPYRRLLAGEG